MDDLTRRLWAKQDVHTGDRDRLFRAVAGAFPAEQVLYPGSYVDVAASFAFASVTYVDVDQRAKRFFADAQGIGEIVMRHEPLARDPQVRFLHDDYTAELPLDDEAFDLLVSLYAGFVSEACGRYLRIGGLLLVNPSHGDAAMAAIDPRFELWGVVTSRAGSYAVGRADLGEHLIAKKPTTITVESLHELGRGVAYTRSPFAYLFERVT